MKTPTASSSSPSSAPAANGWKSNPANGNAAQEGEWTCRLRVPGRFPERATGKQDIHEASD